jgi:hypothetical protein
VTLVNYGGERVEAEVRLDIQKMGFGDVAADTVAIRDVDSGLLRYFDNDVTQMERPAAPEAGLLEDELGDVLGDLTLEEPPTLEERKAADPDGEFKWEDGVLRCPVRRHDFRLFEFVTHPKPDGGHADMRR